MSKYFVCDECGWRFTTPNSNCLYSKEFNPSVVAGFSRLVDATEGDGEIKNKGVKYFCSEKCRRHFFESYPGEYFKTVEEAKAYRKGAKNEKKAAKAEKKKETLEKAKVTSTESLSKVSHLCLTMGYLGVHRFAVGKFISGIAMPGVLVFGIMMAITERDATMLAISAVDIVWWLFDFATIKAKKFTDKFGNTIKEN